MQIYYFPGFNGGAHSATYRYIKSYYPDAQVSVYDFINFIKAKKQIENQLAERGVHENTLFIGQSLGGYWAEYFAHKHDLNLILINPCLEPLQTALRFVVHDKVSNLVRHTTKGLDVYRRGKAKRQLQIILSENDQTVSPKPVYEKYGHDFPYVRVPGTHRFTGHRELLDVIGTF
jgi:predicted esterase YcpF (UPF0227 family)